MLATLGGTAHASPTWTQLSPISGDGKCVALDQGEGFFNNNTRVFQWSCNGHLDQKWSAEFYGESGGSSLYLVVNEQSGKCMEARNGGTDNGTVVDQFDCQRGFLPDDPAVSRQLWVINRVPNVTNLWHNFRPWNALQAGLNKCLDVDLGHKDDDGARVEIWDCNFGGNQVFETDVAII
jgi:hypothetical protein